MNDSPVIARTPSGKFSKHVTVIRPERVKRPGLPSFLKSMNTGMSLTVFGKFAWTIYDQFGETFPAGIPVTERISGVTKSGVVSVGMKSGSLVVTGSAGEVYDSYKIDFSLRWPASASFYSMAQTIVVGNWEADTMSTIHPDSSLGTSVGIFE